MEKKFLFKVKIVSLLCNYRFLSVFEVLVFLGEFAGKASWSSLSWELLLRLKSNANFEFILLNDVLVEVGVVGVVGVDSPELTECEPMLCDENDELILEKIDDSFFFSLFELLLFSFGFLMSLLFDRFDVGIRVGIADSMAFGAWFSIWKWFSFSIEPRTAAWRSKYFDADVTPDCGVFDLLWKNCAWFSATVFLCFAVKKRSLSPKSFSFLVLLDE